MDWDDEKGRGVYGEPMVSKGLERGNREKNPKGGVKFGPSFRN